ncbi:MAG: peroxiredoxin family protein [Phycisphaerae bacterium]
MLMRMMKRAWNVGILGLALVMVGGCAQPRGSSLEKQVPRLGAVAPDFVLPDAHGGKVSLAEARKKGPVLLVFYLGYSCPRCMAHVSELAARKKDLDADRTQVLLIGPDSVEDAQGSIESFGDFPFAMLCDPSMAVAKKYGIVEKDILFHGAFIVDQAGKIRFAAVGPHPYEDVDHLLSVLDGLEERK